MHLNTTTRIGIFLLAQTLFWAGTATAAADDAALAGKRYVVTDAGADFNVRRLERFFALIGRCGAKAVVLLNKADLFSETKNLRAAKIIRPMRGSSGKRANSRPIGVSALLSSTAPNSLSN